MMATVTELPPDVECLEVMTWDRQSYGEAFGPRSDEMFRRAEMSVRRTMDTYSVGEVGPFVHWRGRVRGVEVVGFSVTVDGKPLDWCDIVRGTEG